VLASAADASLQCPNGGNLIPNCGFETADTSFWTLNTAGSFVTSTSFAKDGLASGVASAQNTFGDTWLVSLEACIEDVAPSTSYEYGAWVRAANTGSALLGVSCIVSVFEAAAAANPCGGSIIGESNGGGNAPFDAFEENVGSGSYVTGAGASDIGIGIGCSREVFDGSFDLYIDDFYLIPTLTVFKNGFASGDTCEWDASVGGGC
jgi:hypothetical protein